MEKLQTVTNQFLTGKRSSISIVFFTVLLAFTALTFLTGNREGKLGGLSLVQAAPNAVTGEWTAALNNKKPGEISLMFLKRSTKPEFSSLGATYPINELQGLARDGVTSATKTPVNFRIVNEAGTFEFEGSFREGKGGGFWKLTPDQNFISALSSRGFNNLSGEQLFLAAIGNLTPKLIDDLKSAGYERLSFDELVEAAMFEITPDFIERVKNKGFTDITLKELIKLRIHDIVK